ncbi:MAG TPA: TetR/AcrR family transcriptional regulator [Candidatus Dormibacteraeota bacterium]|jgi:AcrR family transcriptional regulator
MAANAAAAVDRREARRQRLLDAALMLFAELGFHDTSVDEVVAHARTSKSAFYEHFESKEDCFRVLLQQEGGALVAAVQAAAREGGDHRERMRLGIAAFVHTCAKRSRVAQLLLVESVGVSPSIEDVRHRLHAEFASITESEVRYAQEHGDEALAGIDPAIYGRAVVGAVNEATSWFLEAGAAGDPQALADQLCRAFVV